MTTGDSETSKRMLRSEKGHNYDGRLWVTLREILVQAVHDVQAAFQTVHPKAPCTAVADFWRSCQVLRHLADVCERLAKSETGRLLAGNHLDAAKEVERAM